MGGVSYQTERAARRESFGDMPETCPAVEREFDATTDEIVALIGNDATDETVRRIRAAMADLLNQNVKVRTEMRDQWIASIDRALIAEDEIERARKTIDGQQSEIRNLESALERAEGALA